MVGGLVQDQEVDVAPHQHAELQAAALAAGENAHRRENILSAKAEGGQPVPGLLGLAAAVVEHGVQRGAAILRKADDLGQIGGADRGPAIEIALIRLLLVHDELQQRGLAGSVVPDERDALAAGDGEGQVPEQDLFSEGLAETFADQHLVAVELPLLEFHRELFLDLWFFGLLQLLDALFHGKGPLVQLVVAHEGPEMQLLGGPGQLFDLGLVLLVLLELLLEAPPALLHIEAVVAAVEFRLAVGDLHAALHHLVQKIAVVTDGEDGALEVEDIVLQPFRGPQIQVVGGLVQQQDVRVLQDQAGQVYPGLLPAGETVKELLPLGCGDLQTVGHPVAVALHAVAAHAAEIVRQTVVRLQQSRGGVLLHLSRQFLHPQGHPREMGLGGAQHVLGGPALRKDGDLGDEADALAGGDADLPLVIIQGAGEDAEEGSLAAAVGTQDAHPLSGVDNKAETVQHKAADLKGFFQIGNCDFSHKGSCLSPRRLS